MNNWSFCLNIQASAAVCRQHRCIVHLMRVLAECLGIAESYISASTCTDIKLRWPCSTRFYHWLPRELFFFCFFPLLTRQVNKIWISLFLSTDQAQVGHKKIMTKKYLTLSGWLENLSLSSANSIFGKDFYFHNNVFWMK